VVPGAGEGRVHQCLRDNFQKLQDGCRKEELKLNIIQSRDVRLRPKLQKACSEEIAVFCKGIQPGGEPAPRILLRPHIHAC
jgi:Golgi apparatus protein 1